MNTRLLEDQIHWAPCQMSGFWNGWISWKKGDMDVNQEIWMLVGSEVKGTDSHFVFCLSSVSLV